jgi:hypothetical protein
MSLLRLIFFLAVIFAVGCELSPKVPNSAKQNYPVTIEDSQQRREKAEREWRRMLDFYKVAQTPPDLYPVAYTPRSLLGVTGGIKILAAAPEPGTEGLALREAVKRFIDQWRDLIGADPLTVSLVAATDAGDAQRLTYRQASYAFPVTGNFGEMTAIISRDGRLLQMDDRFIPVVELPQRPAIDREEAARRVVGRTFTYSDIAGRPQQVKINNPGEIKVKRVVVAPVEKSDAIEVHLAWEIVAGSSLSWTVYIDAMTGEELKVVQNFQT